MLTISKAARYALAGDSVIIKGGVYREWVSPENYGISEQRRITYISAPDEEVWIKGSEVVSSWRKNRDGVWVAKVPNTIFGDFNPFDVKMFGDWMQKGFELHLGEVYIDNKALIEQLNAEDVISKPNSWHSVVDDEYTTIIANFDDRNPNKSLTEINVRPACFYPKTTGVNYITVKNLNFSQAATQWAPPTAEQQGMVGPNWSLRWVIDGCVLSNSKCVGLSVGKPRASGQNMWELYRKHDGYNKYGHTREIESIFKAYELGWNKETVGSHIISNNKIFDCGQAGIVGHMGGAFSKILNNEIYDINTNKAIAGFEIGGIKLHAAIDTRIEGNFISNTHRGIWLDWQNDGIHVVGNILEKNMSHDLFVEVSHGPTLVYNNLFLSDMSLISCAQGVAIFNNLLAGNIQYWSSKERYTPFHHPHSTRIKGMFGNNGGEMKFYNNVFLAQSKDGERGARGISVYNSFPPYTPEMGQGLESIPDYLHFKFPIWTGGNLYFSKRATPYKHEVGHTVLPDDEASVEVKRVDGEYRLSIKIGADKLAQATGCAINTQMLGQTIMSEAVYENADGTPFNLEEDFFGYLRDVQSPTVGPFEDDTKELVWSLAPREW